jgi:hypothetical protein
MDSGNANPQQGQASMSQKIVSYITQRMGTRHGNGECFTLADDALKNAGAKSAADYGKVTPSADYVWGTAVGASDVKVGDIKPPVRARAGGRSP